MYACVRFSRVCGSNLRVLCHLLGRPVAGVFERCPKLYWAQASDKACILQPALDNKFALFVTVVVVL